MLLTVAYQTESHFILLSILPRSAAATVSSPLLPVCAQDSSHLKALALAVPLVRHPFPRWLCVWPPLITQLSAQSRLLRNAFMTT